MSAESDHSPLAQFEIKPLIPLHFGDHNLSFTNSSLWMVILVSVILLVFAIASRKRALVPGRVQGLSEMLIEWISSTMRTSAGADSLKYFPLVFSLFLFILCANLMGMIPYSFTVTSHIAVTFAMAACVFLAVTLLAIIKHGPIKFAHFFLPEGTPLLMAPLLFVIELFSYLARPISLSIRLAANMTAGHVTLKVIAGLIIIFGVYGGWAMFPILVMLIGFEFGIAIIQAYIFTVLTCVYLHDALHLH